MKMNLRLLLVACAFFMTSCATILTGSTQTLHVRAIDLNTREVIPGVQCHIVDGEGRNYEVDQNPGATIISKGKGALNVDCRKPGYAQKQMGVGQSFNAFTLVNVIFWPGFIVDAATGSLQKYPSHVTVLMERKG